MLVALLGQSKINQMCFPLFHEGDIVGGRSSRCALVNDSGIVSFAWHEAPASVTWRYHRCRPLDLQSSCYT
jgi:hypothetical protein